MGFLFRKRTEIVDEVTLMALEAQSGNEKVRETLLKQYTPYILRVVSSYCNHFVVMGEDDEASIGLLAFNEAIDKYSSDKGAKFLTFAEVVIKRRLTDFYRKESKFNTNVISMSSFQEDQNQKDDMFLEVEQATKVYEMEQEAFDKKQEIIQFSKMLAKFDISMSDLVKISPKHHDARCRAYEVAKLISKHDELVKYLWKKKSLPLKKIESKVDVSRKTLERQRKYIIALVLILQGNFDHLQSYISSLGREG